MHRLISRIQGRREGEGTYSFTVSDKEGLEQLRELRVTEGYDRRLHLHSMSTALRVEGNARTLRPFSRS